MSKFVNDFGCKAEFDDRINDERIKERLSWLGGNWIEVKDEV